MKVPSLFYYYPFSFQHNWVESVNIGISKNSRLACKSIIHISCFCQYSNVMSASIFFIRFGIHCTETCSACPAKLSLRHKRMFRLRFGCQRQKFGTINYKSICLEFFVRIVMCVYVQIIILCIHDYSQYTYVHLYTYFYMSPVNVYMYIQVIYYFYI